MQPLMAITGAAAAGDGTLTRALQAVRSHLGMEVAYISEFVDGRSEFRRVDAPGLEHLLKAGDSLPLDQVYCQHILEGRLPEMIPDTSLNAFAMSMPITTALPVGKHMSVPILLPDGTAYGMFCCLGREADLSLRPRDLQMMKTFAAFVAFEINRDLETDKAVRDTRARVTNAIDRDELSIVYQPIWKIDTLEVVGLECLARFSANPYRSPDLWFRDAAETGLGTALEIIAINSALSTLASLPRDVYLAINASPETVLSPEFLASLDGIPAKRVVLEITEHAHVADYDQLLGVLRPLRDAGMRLAVDDAGAGYSSLKHIVHLQPDLIKLDMSLTRNIDLDPARRALASALALFSRETGSLIIAEGVETAAELAALKGLGIELAQGYFLARPMSRGDAIALLVERGRQLTGPQQG